MGRAASPRCARAGRDHRVESRGRAEPDGVHARLPHHPLVARSRAAGDDADRELPGPAPWRCRRVEARTALVEGGRGDLRGRSRDRDRALVRVRAPLAGVHRALRLGLRSALCDRGDLLLPRGDLHRDLHLRLEAPVAVGPLLDRRSGRDHRSRRGIFGRRRELVDEPAAGLLAHDRHGHLGRAVEGDLQPGGALRGPAHDPRRLSRHRVPGGLDLRGRDAARQARPPPPPRAADPADRRVHRDAHPVRRWRHRGPGDREGPADQVRGHGMCRQDLDRRHGVHLRPMHPDRGQGRNRDPGVRLLPRGLEHEHPGDRARLRPARRPAAGEHDAPLGVRHDGRDLQRADPARALARHRLVAEEGLPAVAVVPARDRRLRGRCRSLRSSAGGS